MIGILTEESQIEKWMINFGITDKTRRSNEHVHLVTVESNYELFEAEMHDLIIIDVSNEYKIREHTWGAMLTHSRNLVRVSDVNPKEIKERFGR